MKYSRCVGFFLCLAVSMLGQAPQSYLNNNTFTNWESPHVHPLDLTPDGTKLLAVNTANSTLEVFDASNASKLPTLLKSIPVGVDPVSVRARTNTEAWVVNVISDSVSVVDLTNGLVTKTLQVDDEPADVIFAGNSSSLALISCAQAKTLLVFNATAPTTPTARIPINGEQPRSLAMSANGRYVYLAIFESGNQTTQVVGGVNNSYEISVVDDPKGPYAGVNPAPNSGTAFLPSINPALTTPPPVSMIVKRTVVKGTVKWMDDNNHDWSAYVNGLQAQNGTAGARVKGWDMPDRDVAVIDTQNNYAVTYQSGLMNILMSMAVNPATGQVTVVGTDATNQIRYEPNLKSTFVRVNFAAFTPGGANSIVDLNPHLNYAVTSIPMAQRQLSIGDPRGIVWNAAGSKAYVTGMGSNNVAIISQKGGRSGLINVGQGPTGIVLQESNGRGFVLNKFDATISTINLSSATETGRTALLYDPTPAWIKAGRPLFYNTQQTSGLGQVACASCHVDARWDRLAWDLGDPSGSAVTNSQGVSYHPMKGPLLTMTLVDVMQSPDLHWRGDRPAMENFEGSFQSLLGADAPATDAQIATLRQYLGAASLVPNPYRNLDDSFSTSVSSPGPNNTIFNTGNAVLGAQEFEGSCRGCHVGQTGRGPLFDNDDAAFGAGVRQPPTWKNFYKRLGLWYSDPTASNSGFGFQQDGTFDSTQNSSRDANLYAFMMSFNGGFPYEPTGLDATNWSNFTHAAVGKQVTLNAANPSDTTGMLAQLKTLAAQGTIGLIVKGSAAGSPMRGWLYLGNDVWQSDQRGQVDSTQSLATSVANGFTLTYTAVPVESAVRMGIDQDGDGLLDFDDPHPAVADANVTNLALKGVASAASQYDDQHGPAAAIDGNTNGYFDQNSLFHSGGGVNDWWQVDLGIQSQISLIQIFNRMDCCATRLSNVAVFVSSNPFTSSDLTATRSQAGVQQFFLTGYAGMTPQIPMSTQGRYVRVQLTDGPTADTLQLAEVRVMGYAIPTFTNPGTQNTAAGTSVSLPLLLNNPAANIYTYTATGLPPGLSINPGSGVISGSPTASANTSSNVVVTANGPGSPAVSFSWNVSFVAPTISNPGTQSSVASAPVTLPLTFTNQTGTAYSFSATGLPAGLIINSSNGTISGTPTATVATSYTTKVTATGVIPVSTSFTWNITIAPGKVVNLSTYYNIDGIGTVGTKPLKGGVDSWSGVAYNAATLGTSVSFGGMTFPFAAANAPDAMYGATVALPAGTYANLYVVGTGVDGAWPNQKFVVKYSDGTTSTFTQSMSNWQGSSAYTGETILLTAGNQLNASGTVVAQPAYVFGYSFALVAGKTPVSVAFPVNTNIVIFGVGLR